MRELWVYLPSYQPSRGMWESHASTYLSFEEIRKNFGSIYQTTCQSSRGMWENCESHTYLSTFHGDVRKLWVYLPTNLLGDVRELYLLTYQPSKGMWENCVFLPIYLPTYLQGSLTSPLKAGRLTGLSHASFLEDERPWVPPPSLPLSGKWKNWDSAYLPTYLPSGYVRELSLPTHIPIFLRGEMWENSESTYLSTHLHS